MGEDEEAPTLQLLTLPEVFIYKIPPMQGSSGHRAADWNLEKPALVGQLRLVSKGEKVYIQLFQVPENSAQLPQLFASSPIKLDPDQTKPNSKLDFFLQSVADSSRYFVLRVEDEASKRHAYLGIGFQERQSAFDLRAAIEDEVKRIGREDQCSDDDEESSELAGPKVDRSLKEGETIKVSIKIGGKSKKKKSSALPSSGGLKLSAPPSVLSAPPRAAAATTSSTSTSVPSNEGFPARESVPETIAQTIHNPPSDAQQASFGDEDPFGDFSSFESALPAPGDQPTPAPAAVESTNTADFPLDDPFSFHSTTPAPSSSTLSSQPALSPSPLKPSSSGPGTMTVTHETDDWGDFQF